MGLNFSFNNRASTGFCVVFPITSWPWAGDFLVEDSWFFQFKEVINDNNKNPVC